jgi:hypothetical protein
MEILDVLLEMLGEHVDARGKERDLNFGRACVALGALVLLDDLRAVCGGDGHELISVSLYAVRSSRMNCLF